MTVMLLQRFATPHANPSQKRNDGLSTSVQSSNGTLGQSTSPSITSLSTASPTPLPFLFLLESQESWEEPDATSINSESNSPETSVEPSRVGNSVDLSNRIYTRYHVPPIGSLIIDDNNVTSNVADATNYDNDNSPNENNNFTVRNNNNNNRRNSRNNYRTNNSVIILNELRAEYEKTRKFGGELPREKREIEGWSVGGEGICRVGGQRDCSGATAAAGNGSVTGGAGSGLSCAGAAAGRFGQTFGLTSTTSGCTVDPRIGGVGAVAACTAATAASSASTCGPIDGLTRLDSQGVAMRYYRLWIYACNIVLLGSAVGFAAAVSRTLFFTGDPRRYLVPGVPRALDPTALYAYLALAAQLGLVQLLGCIAARRLSAKLLNAYWMLLLALLFGDAVIGVAWVFRFERMRAELRPSLRLRLQLEYGKENRFSEHWDRLQRDFSCCGIAGHEDFEATSLDRLPQTCCPPSQLGGSIVSFGANNTADTCQQPYPRGCEDSLVDWLRKTADLLFVLGICVIAFAKLCFLGILRYEIREMIQKIRLLREPPLPPPSAIIGGSSSILCTASPPFVQSFSQLGVSPVVDSILTTNTNSHINNNNNNNMSSNNNNNAGAGAGPRRTTLPMAALPSGNSSILQQSDDYSGVRHPLLSSNLQDGGADSDTNSHCALILEETTPPSISTHSGCTASTRPDKSNGNNNYEMREFNRRLLISNGSGPGNINAGPRNRRT